MASEGQSTAKDFNAGANPSTLVDAIDRGVTIRKLYDMLHRGADPEQANAAGRKPMDAAMDREWYEAADLLMQAGAKPPACDGPPDGPFPYDGRIRQIADEIERETALTYLIQKAGGYKVMYTYIANGADVNLPNEAGQSPLAVAVHQRPWHFVATQLVKRGAWIDPDERDPDEIIDKTTGATRLLSVIMEGRDAAAVQNVLDSGADPDKPDRYGLTPVALARALDWPSVEKMLQAAGANPDVSFPDPNQRVGAKNDKPLICYTVSGQSCHLNYQTALLEAGADPDAKGPDGRGAIHWAAIYGRTSVFDELAAHGADILSACDQQKLTPLQYACMNNRFDIASRILDAHPEAIAQAPTDKSGDTLLHMAAGREGSARLVQLLIDCGAVVNARNSSGDTPLHKAVDAHDADMVRVLLKNGADLDKANEGKRYNPPLFSLINRDRDAKNAQIAKILLDAGASPHIRATEAINGPSKGDSILYHAIRYGAWETARELLKAGADPHDTSYIGASAMHHCLQLRQIEGVKLLLEFGFDPLRVFDFTEQWHGGGVTNVRYCQSSYDNAKELVEKFGHDREYGTMLDIIEHHLLSPAPAAAPKNKPQASPAP